ncbi:MAG TPA: hypothetical protein PLC15_02165 [Candidatus Obscuribacter sp.]|nr:hypothetical protein [Candidatus Obscuribacter sp.]HMX44372.1 hypothetical protein [Candidatus Obscuribacter sp.]HMY52327.1 hypothetical protein [Candidatus Obscuribacter sp.]HNB14152.1 hypothetical protein [Candidatus Obscuribacter sp.]HND05091.1 hypothetical protein [Candidatus Obscuribacter sp.]
MKTTSTTSRKDNAKFALVAFALVAGVAILRGLTELQERFGKRG